MPNTDTFLVPHTSVWTMDRKTADLPEFRAFVIDDLFIFLPHMRHKCDFQHLQSISHPNDSTPNHLRYSCRYNEGNSLLPQRKRRNMRRVGSQFLRCRRRTCRATSNKALAMNLFADEMVHFKCAIIRRRNSTLQVYHFVC